MGRAGLSRRSFLLATAGGALAACSGSDSPSAPPVTTATVGGSSMTTTASTLPPGPSFATNPFTLGVASGDPTADSVILWTRLASDPRAPDGGVVPAPVTIGWQVGADDRMAEIVASGQAVADPGFAHSVHVDIRDLDPARTYWYRFFVGSHESEIGRTRTTPAAGDLVPELVFAQVSCQRYDEGYWTAFEDLAVQSVDAVLHCGDYIYERGNGLVRSLDLPEAIDLDGYRSVYGAYKAEESLRAAHLVAPWIVTWDDHEVENNYQGDTPQEGSSRPDPVAFAARKAAAYQAWWEHMPVRLPAPTGTPYPIHRGIDFGGLVSLSVLDTRQYRTNHACAPSDLGPRCEGADRPEYTVLGSAQEGWLRERLGASDAKFTALQQGVVMQQWRLLEGVSAWNLDQWDGYPAARAQLFEDLRTAEAENPIVLTGDVHSSWVGSLSTDFDDPAAEKIGTEFVGTSVSSDGSILEPLVPNLLSSNPHIEWAQVEKRGWTRHTVTPDQWGAEFREVEDATVEGSVVGIGSRWVVPDGEAVTRS